LYEWQEDYEYDIIHQGNGSFEALEVAQNMSLDPSMKKKSF